jgi:hypothetical protein
MKALQGTLGKELQQIRDFAEESQSKERVERVERDDRDYNVDKDYQVELSED